LNIDEFIDIPEDWILCSIGYSNAEIPQIWLQPALASIDKKTGIDAVLIYFVTPMQPDLIRDGWKWPFVAFRPCQHSTTKLILCVHLNSDEGRVPKNVCKKREKDQMQRLSLQKKG